MPGGRQIPSDVIDLREYKKNNQVRDFKNLVIAPFAAEANKTYLLGAIPKGAVIVGTQTIENGNITAGGTGLKIGDINDHANGVDIANDKIHPDGGDLFITPGAVQNKGYIIRYMNTGITDGAYAG